MQTVKGESQLAVGRSEVASLLEELGVGDVAAAKPFLGAERIEDAPRLAKLGVDTVMVAALGRDATQPLVALGQSCLLVEPLSVCSRFDRVGLRRVHPRPRDVDLAQAHQYLGPAVFYSRLVDQRQRAIQRLSACCQLTRL